MQNNNIRLLYRELKSWSKSSLANDSWNKIIQSQINEEILYFPTYRRIEEDLREPGVLDVELEDQLLIKFGLTDVERRIESLINKIKEISLKWFLLKLMERC